jgi:hypothetical protein
MKANQNKYYEIVVDKKFMTGPINQQTTYHEIHFTEG